MDKKVLNLSQDTGQNGYYLKYHRVMTHQRDVIVQLNKYTAGNKIFLHLPTMDRQL